MARRTYDQYCGLAHALDLVGERWTLLIVRELMTGPKRYSDLAQNLPGIGTSLLATRLKQLASEGIADRSQLPPPAASAVYELTSAGAELARALMPLALWGARHAVPEDPGPAEQVRAEWTLLAFTHLVDQQALTGVDLTIRFVVDGSVAYLRILDGRAEIHPGDSRLAADATVHAAPGTLATIGAGRVTVASAVTEGLVRLEGDEELLALLAGVLDDALGKAQP